MLSEQFDIIEATNGEEAAAILHQQESEISLMLLDIVMPVMDGFELLTLMNKNGWIKSIPVIMISAESVPAYVDRAYDLGVMEFITRPFDERTVQHRVVSSIMLTAKQKELSSMVTQQMYEKEKTNRLMIEILSNLVEFRNGESGLHVVHIQTLTELVLDKLLTITDRYPITKKDRSLISTAAALHDIGKIAIPYKILNKPGKLTNEEFAIMKTHAAEGARILNNIVARDNEPLIQYAYQICRWHHERYDGHGYPDGLKGDEIPIAAQVVALGDVYDALTSERVYKKAYSHETAVEMILNGECGCFNPLLLECLRQISDQLAQEMKNANRVHSSEQSIMKSVDEMVTANELNSSERTLRLLEREQAKFRFLSERSQDILFEYSVTPEMITFSEQSAHDLGLAPVIVNPREKGLTLFAPEDLDDLLSALEHTSPAQPDVDKRYRLTLPGGQRWCCVTARSLWENNNGLHYEGAIGKILDTCE
jgi:putative two-component system response regulator